MPLERIAAWIPGGPERWANRPTEHEHIHRRRQTEDGLLKVLGPGQGGQIAVQRVFQPGDFAGGLDGPLQHSALARQIAGGRRHRGLNLPGRGFRHLCPVLSGRIDRRLPKLGLPADQRVGGLHHRLAHPPNGDELAVAGDGAGGRRGKAAFQVVEHAAVDLRQQCSLRLFNVKVNEHQNHRKRKGQRRRVEF